MLFFKYISLISKNRESSIKTKTYELFRFRRRLQDRRKDLPARNPGINSHFIMLLLSRKRADILRENYESLFQQYIAIIVSN